jgi:hypothetical protein
MSKKTIPTLTILISLASLTASGQRIADDCGLDKSAKLNKCELGFFEAFFADSVFKKKDYNFQDKKFAFLSAGQLIDKDVFFKNISDYRGPKGFDFFNKDQVAKTGYDGIISINLKTYNLDIIAEMIKKQKNK